MGFLHDLIWGPPATKMVAAAPAKQLTADPDSLVGTLERLTAVSRTGVWRAVSIREALGVPAIHRAVALISSTVGMLSVQAYRNGALMPDPPLLLLRPDPRQTAGAFYSGTAADMAKYGEFVWWIANTDPDGHASALVRVPPFELRVQEDFQDRLTPTYIWGSKTGTRYSGANPDGRFVHVMYPLADAFDLRGKGPLQLCGVANSVAVESENWAGNFYGEGGHPATVIKKAGLLSPTKLDPSDWLPMDPTDPDYETRGRSEADLIRDQVIGRANNTPMVIDEGIESITFQSPNTVGAQMLDARLFNNGQAALQFGIPGVLLEYQQRGGAITYQNRSELKGHLLEMCLMPLYLEPIEQAMSDLLTRSTVARFNVKGFLRADIKTRYEVYDIAANRGILSLPEIRREEGYEPGDVEYQPAPFAQPAAVPGPLQRFSLMRDVRCDQCGRKLARATGEVEVVCRHCKRVVAA